MLKFVGQCYHRLSILSKKLAKELPTAKKNNSQLIKALIIKALSAHTLFTHPSNWHKNCMVSEKLKDKFLLCALNTLAHRSHKLNQRKATHLMAQKN